MHSLKLTNTLKNKKEEFVPLDNNNIRMYVCGPTVYDYPHVGNARPLIVFDVLFRVLKKIYKKSKVNYVRNITDIDDKIIEASKKNKISIKELTETVTKNFHDDCEYLGCLKPTYEPRATDNIPEMVQLVLKLLDKGFAYSKNNHVYFDILKFKSYGKLSNKKIEDLIAGSRVEISENKSHPGDFVLWKPSNDDEPAWESPFGKGRPGWHLECSAMSEKYLGKQFDIHGGGLDLIFPHHENEIAQSECANNIVNFANYWVHNGYVTINKQKMSKSLNNFLTINELKNKFNGQVVRLAMLSTHYTQPFDWNNQILESAKSTLDKWYNFYSPDNVEINEDHLEDILDDLNTPKMIANIHKLYDQSIRGSKDSKDQLSACCKLLGLFNQSKEKWISAKSIGKLSIKIIEETIKERNLARKNKDFKTSDQLRKYLEENDIIINDIGSNTEWKYK